MITDPRDVKPKAVKLNEYGRLSQQFEDETARLKGLVDAIARAQNEAAIITAERRQFAVEAALDASQMPAFIASVARFAALGVFVKEVGQAIDELEPRLAALEARYSAHPDTILAKQNARLQHTAAVDVGSDLREYIGQRIRWDALLVNLPDKIIDAYLVKWGNARQVNGRWIVAKIDEHFKSWIDEHMQHLKLRDGFDNMLYDLGEHGRVGMGLKANSGNTFVTKDGALRQVIA